jgi:hypothetical protein
MLLRDGASFDLALRVRSRAGAPLGEVFSFLSGLYFRGKVAYSAAFASPPEGARGAYVITTSEGLRPVDELVTVARLRRFGTVDIDGDDPRYRRPLTRDARALDELLPREAEIVLLGSIATGKYVDALTAVFGERLLFPSDFVGRGDMSRGGLMLRAAREGTELPYIPVLGAVRKGKRPPKLAPIRRTRVALDPDPDLT